MYVIEHDGKAMALIAVKLLFSITEGLHNTGGDLWHTQVQWAGAGVVEEAVQGEESFAGGEVFGREDAVVRERAFQAEGHEERVPSQVPGREAAFVAVHV